METGIAGDRVVRENDSLNTQGTILEVFPTAGVYVRWDNGSASIEDKRDLRPLRMVLCFGKAAWA